MTDEQHNPTYDDFAAACDFRDSLVPRADGRVHGAYPYWHGWALVDAYLAGLKAGREEAAKTKESNHG